MEEGYSPSLLRATAAELYCKVIDSGEHWTLAPARSEPWKNQRPGTMAQLRD